ncbi:MAG TPA: type II toxin-antitoxin system death-on-curing family toxin [Candidatus Saccharimonadales bacterium]|nr:type II toxin-antitoxin system death-on-curing family toxin [Candidatus Saccharimonadales bacterium]
MTTLSLEQLLELHALVVEATGGSMGLRDLGRLEAAVATQTQNVFDEELYPSIIDKAAAMIRGIIADHPFVDGNKRTAMLAGLSLLQINAIRFIAQPGEIEDFAVKVATDRLDVPAICAWLHNHTETNH